MAIRTQKLKAAARTKTHQEWSQEIESLLTDLAQAVSSADPHRFSDILQSTTDWDDPHRRLQFDLQASDLTASINLPSPRKWGPFYYRAASHLLRQLERDPIEPARWNFLGMMLFELGKTRAAERCFKATLRLHPGHPQARGNLKAVKQRRKRTITNPFDPAMTSQLNGLAEQAIRAADKAKLRPSSEFKLSLAMIVKDEEEMLPACLESVQGVVDEMVIVDTGSSDRTVEIAESFGATVLHHEWNGSFSDARNVSLDAATGDWILHLDADERILPEDKDKLRPLLARTYREGFLLVETNYTGEGEIGAVTHSTLRLWRHRPEYRFKGAIHEQKSHNMPNYLPERFEHTSLRMLHYGYLKEIISSRGKSERNLTLLLEEAEEDPSPFNRFNIGTEYLLLEQPDLAREYFDEAWEKLQLLPDGPPGVGFGAMCALRTVRARRESGDIESAQQGIEEGLSYYPDHTDLVIEQAAVAQLRDDLPSAINLMEKALSMGDAPAPYGGVVGIGTYLGKEILGQLHERSGNFARAVEYYRQVLDQEKDYRGVLAPLTRSLLRSGQEIDQVLDELRPHIEGRLTSSGLMVAHTLYEQQQIPAARDLYEQVIKASPDHQLARLGLVECSLSEGEMEQVRDLTEELDENNLLAAELLRSRLFALILLDQAPSLPDLEAEATRLGLPRNETQAFLAWVDGSTTQNLEPAPAAFLAGVLLPPLLRLQRFEAAETVILLVHGSQLPLAEQCPLLASSFFSAGYLESAADEWIRWIQAEGESSAALVGLSQVAYAREMVEDALALAHAAVELDPEYAPAQRLLTSLNS